ncbi:hypothetical protein CR513_18524, partial [Mucuna pruriens]
MVTSKANGERQSKQLELQIGTFTLSTHSIFSCSGIVVIHSPFEGFKNIPFSAASQMSYSLKFCNSDKLKLDQVVHKEGSNEPRITSSRTVLPLPLSTTTVVFRSLQSFAKGCFSSGCTLVGCIQTSTKNTWRKHKGLGFLKISIQRSHKLHDKAAYQNKQPICARLSTTPKITASLTTEYRYLVKRKKYAKLSLTNHRLEALRAFYKWKPVAVGLMAVGHASARYGDEGTTLSLRRQKGQCISIDIMDHPMITVLRTHQNYLVYGPDWKNDTSTTQKIDLSIVETTGIYILKMEQEKYK